MTFAENLRWQLDEKNVEVKELAAGTGISKYTIDNYLSGQKSIPNAENAVKIARYLGTTVEFLVTGESAPKETEEFLTIFTNLRRLKSADFASIRTIVQSLAEK